MNVTVNQLAAVIEAMQGAQPATMRTYTDADLLKTGNPFGMVNKFSHVNAFVGVNYEKAVNRQQVREGADEGTFEVSPPKWGRRIGKKLVIHTPKGEDQAFLYCPVAIKKVLTAPRYVEASTDVELTSEQVAPFQRDKGAETEATAEAQGVDKPVIWRTYRIANILAMTIGGDTYDVVPEDQANPDVPAVHLDAPVEEQEPAVVI